MAPVKLISTLQDALRQRQFLRFVLVGFVNTAFSYGVYAVLLFFGLNFALSNLGAVALGILFSFTTHGRLVFNYRGYGRLFRYVLFWLLIYLCNIGLIKLLLCFDLNAYIAGALALPPIALISFVLQKYIVFLTVPASAIEHEI